LLSACLASGNSSLARPLDIWMPKVLMLIMAVWFEHLWGRAGAGQFTTKDRLAGRAGAAAKTTCSRASSHPYAGKATHCRGLQALCATTLRFAFDLNTTTRKCLGHRLAAGSRTLGALALHGRRSGNTALHSPPPTTPLRSLPYGHYEGGRYEPVPRAQTKTKRFGIGG
jgi:hypothetical protein